MIDSRFAPYFLLDIALPPAVSLALGQSGLSTPAEVNGPSLSQAHSQLVAGFQAQESDAVRADDLSDLLHGVMRGNQVVGGVNIRAEVAGMQQSIMTFPDSVLA